MLRSRSLLQTLLQCLLLTLGFSNAGARTLDVIHGFDSPQGNPLAGVIEGSDHFLYGTTYYGGAGDDGTVFRMNNDGTGFLILHSFNREDRSNGDTPRSPLIEGSDGILYGTTYWGGLYQNGIVFKVNRNGSGFRKLHDFRYGDDANGSNPTAGLLEGSDGALYGTTYFGGVNGVGVVFKINKDGTDFMKFYDFGERPNGSLPYAGLIEGSDGALYGTTYEGGLFGYGAVFRLSKDGTGFAILHDFRGDNGGGPYASLVEGSNGTLYGTTYWGGQHGDGVVFKVNKEGTGFKKLHDFNGDDGDQPTGGFMEGSDGTLYGTTQYGGVDDAGVVFKIDKDGTGFATVHDFKGTDGEQAVGIVEGSDGGFYGTTAYGGAYGSGGVFKLKRDAGFLELYAFGSPDGANPTGEVIEGSDGSLYGTARNGGTHHAGIVFRMNKDGTGFVNLHNFNEDDVANGFSPRTALVEGADSVLYGTTFWGGSHNAGIIFKINRDGSGFLKLHEFSGDDGWFPSARLLEGSDGVLYGTTLWGGLIDALYGVIFKINKDGSGFATLHDFDRDVDGYQPSAGLIEGADGTLYGTTTGGGTYTGGGVFKINKDGSGFATLHHFNESEGANPSSALLEGSDGALYGTTQFGGASDFGTVFKINRNGSGFETLHYFNERDGKNSEAGLIEGHDGKLYGTTESGGAHDSGVIFKVNNDGTGFQKVHDFDRGDISNGARPLAGLAKGSDGSAYGTTEDGGPGGGGVVYRLTSGCKASLQIQGEVHAPGGALAVRIHIAHRRPETVTVPWELRLLDPSGQEIVKRTTKPHTFEPGDVVDRDVEFRLPDDLASGTYKLELAISGMAGTKGATRTFRVVRTD